MFAISTYILVYNGVRRVIGKGGVIRCINTTQEAGLMLASRTPDGQDPVSRCRVEGLQIDCCHIKTAVTIGIYGQNIRACEIVGNRVFHLLRGSGILVRALAGSGADAADNLIENNQIEADQASAPACHGITLDAVVEGPGAMEQWKTRFVAKTAGQVPRRNRVIGNRVTGGYYGLNISLANQNTVRGNRLQHQVRNMSLQNSCVENLVEDNDCCDSLSSAIHLAYGSARNRIADNRIRTRRARGEGLLQAYVGAVENVFEDNTVEAIAPAAPKYYIYAGVHADGNRFLNNRLSGACLHAYIAVETAFNPASNDPTHRNYRLAPATGHFTARGMGQIVIRGNRIEGDSPVPALYLAQISDDRGRYALSDCRLVENTVATAAPTPYLKLVEDTPELLSGLVLVRNTFPPDAGPQDFLLPRGVSHFDLLEGNVNLRIDP